MASSKNMLATLCAHIENDKTVIEDINNEHKQQNPRTVFIRVEDTIFYKDSVESIEGFLDWFTSNVNKHDVVILLSSRRQSLGGRDSVVTPSETIDALNELKKVYNSFWWD